MHLKSYKKTSEKTSKFVLYESCCFRNDEL